MAVRTLKKRAEFLRLRGGARFATPAFVLETRPSELEAATAATPARPDAADTQLSDMRFGYTVTKKLGGAVMRNRIRRRLKAAVSVVAPKFALSGHDYVLVARAAAYDRAFPDLKKDLERALQRVHHAAANPLKGKPS